MKYTVKSNNGFSALLEILSYANEICMSESKHYDAPKFIFRGITMYSDIFENGTKSVEEWTIRSGLSIRLEKTYAKEYSKADYISYLIELISHAKKRFPNKYKEGTSDLDILADIQHNGGATCLVDFSKNILTALWFACQSDEDYDGHLFCYNIMEDMIVNNNLTYIKPQEAKNKIEDILTQTYKLTNYCSDVTNRFCLWNPSNMNNRIVRQDSVFLFGIEKFIIKEHGIITITIPRKLKSEIVKVLKVFFNISYATIYNDSIGYANSNNKMQQLYYDIPRKADRSYMEGYNNMLRGNYVNALKYFKQCEGAFKNMSNSDRLELAFSMAICYKNLSCNNDYNYYCENAMIEYRNAMRLSLQLVKYEKTKVDQDDSSVNYYSRKCIRAYNEMLELQYSMKKYREGIKLCDNIIEHIKNHDIISKNRLQINICNIAKLELYALDTVVYGFFENNVLTFVNRIEKDPDNSYFDKLLIKYYKLIYLISKAENEKIRRSFRKEIGELKTAIYANIKDKEKYQKYIDWNFVDIKNAIEKSSSKYSKEAINLMEEATALIISARDLFENQCWRIKTDI